MGDSGLSSWANVLAGLSTEPGYERTSIDWSALIAAWLWTAGLCAGLGVLTAIVVTRRRQRLASRRHDSVARSSERSG